MPMIHSATTPLPLFRAAYPNLAPELRAALRCENASRSTVFGRPFAIELTGSEKFRALAQFYFARLGFPLSKQELPPLLTVTLPSMLFRLRNVVKWELHFRNGCQMGN
jgi:hypothetical protein